MSGDKNASNSAKIGAGRNNPRPAERITGATFGDVLPPPPRERKAPPPPKAKTFSELVSEHRLVVAATAQSTALVAKFGPKSPQASRAQMDLMSAIARARREVRFATGLTPPD